MDIRLRTQTDDPALALVDIERPGDYPECISRLQIRSRGFLLDRPFYFHLHELSEFLKSLKIMDETLNDIAKLQTRYEDHSIQLAVGPSGYVEVTGEIHEYSNFDQFLRFGFGTDQTVLRPLIRDIEELTALLNP